MNYPDTIDGRCTNCGDTDLMLATDFTEYSGCEYMDGKWTTPYADTQATDAPDAVRFFCTSCGTQHAVPEELT